MAASDWNQSQGHGTHFYILLWDNVNVTSMHGKKTAPAHCGRCPKPESGREVMLPGAE